MSDNIKVTVFCITYNHEKYIRAALEGFVSQKTDFDFEVLVHDDASTDSTAAIVKEFEEKYPDIIKPVYQTENQYSRGGGIIRRFLLPLARGEYFAWCEGDDSWTDPYKLQKQVDFLDSHPEHTLVGTGCTLREETEDGYNDSVIPLDGGDKDYSLRDLLYRHGEIYMFCTVMMRRQIFESLPEEFKGYGFGDVQLYFYSAINGKCHCLSDVTAVSNRGVAGSWTARVWAFPEKRVEHYYRLIGVLERFDKYYDYKYHADFGDRINTVRNDRIRVVLKKSKLSRSEKFKLIWKCNRKDAIRMIGKSLLRKVK